MSAQSFRRFIYNVCSNLDPVADATAVVAFDDHLPGVLMLRMDGRDPAAESRVDQLLAQRPRALALCQRLAWSPDHTPASAAWAVTAICPEFPARFTLRRDGDGHWREIAAEQAPCPLLHCAASLRAALDSGQWLAEQLSA